jgi:hypothetical protein
MIFNLFLGLPALGTDLKSRKGLYSGPSPIPKSQGVGVVLMPGSYTYLYVPIVIGIYK